MDIATILGSENLKTSLIALVQEQLNGLADKDLVVNILEQLPQDQILPTLKAAAQVIPVEVVHAKLSGETAIDSGVVRQNLDELYKFLNSQ